jgi:programmed cell death protein 5
MEQYPNPEASKIQEESKKAAEEQREIYLTQILTPQAKERLGRISLVKQEKAREIENSLLSMAMRRQITGKITEDQLIAMIEKTTDNSSNSIKVIRRKGIDSDDDDLEEF